MDYARYLRAKRSVDDRAFNLNVLNEFESYVACAALQNSVHTLRVIEVGAGVGDMFQRLLRRRTMFSATEVVHYTLLDIKPELLKSARLSIGSRLSTSDNHLCSNHVSLHLPSPAIVGGCGVHHRGFGDEEEVENLEDLILSESITVSFVVGNALKYLENCHARFDVIIGAAVLDLWELESATKVLLNALDIDAGVSAFYFPINFDGTTSFYPESCEGCVYDRYVEERYHMEMGQRLVRGREIQACHTGRLLVPVLRDQNAIITAAGSSSWMVYPNIDGKYESDERFFLSCILDFVESTLDDSTGEEYNKESGAFLRYLQDRRGQLLNGKLCYLAHNVDVCGHLILKPNQP